MNSNPIPAPPAETPPQAAPQSRLVLIVEDNPTNSRLAAEMLRAAGHQTLIAADGATGLKLARAEAPDLILTDLQMSGMDGLELVGHLKADPITASIPVVAVTAHAMSEHRDAALQAGCCSFITKPFRYRAFLDEISQILRSGQNAN